MKSVYDTIGVGYHRTRRSDPRIAERIVETVGDAESVVNVGAGTGSYEPRDRQVVAVEPSVTMIRQRDATSAFVVQGTAENLPLRDGAVDVALAILTIHHWNDPARGLAEMQRVARRGVVIFTWEQAVFEDFWLLREYFPGICDRDRARALDLAYIVSALGEEAKVVPIPIPHDCADGFLGAFWQRPEAYLDPRVRAGISAFPPMSSAERDAGLGRLEADLKSGAWERKHRNLLDLRELDLGYRLIVAGSGAPETKRASREIQTPRNA